MWEVSRGEWVEMRVKQMASRTSKSVAKCEETRVGVKLSTLVREGKSKKEDVLWMPVQCGV